MIPDLGERAGCIFAAIHASDLWLHRNPTRADRARFADAEGGPFSFRRAVPIFAACAIPWSVIRQSCVRSAAGRRSSDIGHFVRAGAPISTSAVGSLAATRLRPTRGTSLTSPRTTDHSIVVGSLVKRSASLKEHGRFSRASPADRTHPSQPRGSRNLSEAACRRVWGGFGLVGVPKSTAL